LAKKTFIKVKRGILEPKHRLKLGESWFLFFYMLDSVNWEDGTIHEWRDSDAADELEINLSTIRAQRRRLENEGYISTFQKQHYLEIKVNNWDDPKHRWGQMDDDEGVAEPVPSNDQNGVQGAVVTPPSKPQGVGQGAYQGIGQGIGQGAVETTPLPLSLDNQITRVSEYQVNNDPTKSFIARFLETAGVQFYPMKALDQAKDIDELVVTFGEDLVLEIADWCRTKRMTSMQKVLSSIRSAAPHWGEGKKEKVDPEFQKLLEEGRRGI